MKTTRKHVLLGGLAAAALIAAAPAQAGKTLDAVKARGSIVCGVNTGLAGFSQADAQGNWSGLDVDVCKAIAAAVLNDPNKVKYVPLTAQQRFTALQSGEIDILSRNTTWTLTRDASLGLHFLATTYYDGQGFMVPVKSKVKSAKQIKGATVCVQSGTTTEKNLTDYSRTNKLDLKPVVFEKQEAATGAYFSGRCAAFTTDASGLASIRNKDAKDPKDKKDAKDKKDVKEPKDKKDAVLVFTESFMYQRAEWPVDAVSRHRRSDFRSPLKMRLPKPSGSPD
jgi:general L-amino acid transport system substrate-binding protein